MHHKDVCNKLVYYSKQINSDGQSAWLNECIMYEESIEDLRTENSNLKHQFEHLKLTEVSTAEKAQVKSVGTQVDIKDISTEQNKKDRERTEELRKALVRDNKFSNLTEIVDQKWPEEIYERTTKIPTRKFSLNQNTEKDEDMLLFVDPNQFSSEDKIEELKNSFPKLMHITEDELKEGSMEFVKLHLEVQKGTTKDQTRYTNTFYALPMTMDNRGVTDLEVIHKLVSQLHEQTTKQPGRKLKVVTTAATNLDYITKTLEFVFRSTEMDIRIAAERNPKSKEGNKQNDNRLEKEKIIIKSHSGKVIKKTNKGDLLLEVVGRKAKTLALKQDIQQGSNNADIVIKANETKVHITDIDASIEQEELKTEIMKGGGKSKEKPQETPEIQPERPTRNGIYKIKRKGLKALINKSKNEKWKDLCNDLENDMWEKAYKLATKKLTGYVPYQLDIKEKLSIARTLFPKQEKTWNVKSSNGNFEPFSEEEYRKALHTLRNGLAPGVEGVPVEALKKAEELKPCALLETMNQHLHR
ncbi:hypothetical protein QE152_g34807 [Popillia japonica]|uniref:Uncharacterized protein n=1 Tax=Popillia japonica TaxID=7064 RepID=A0AAW1IT52_POPJA